MKQVGGVCAVQVGPGSTLASRYRLVRLLGRGGMAEVYEANDGVVGRRVAVKVFRDETDIATSQARQQLEIQALARLQHPNIVPTSWRSSTGDRSTASTTW